MLDAQQPESAVPQITTSNTKQEMLAAYKEVVKRLKEKRETELKPQLRSEEKQKEEAVKVADSLSTEGIAREVGNLRSEISKVLIELSDRMEEEIGKYLHIKRAVEAREKELKELSEIEKEALSLAALLEAQKERRERFDGEMSEKKQSLEAEIASTRAAWKEEQKAHEGEVQAREAAEKRRREREAEEYTYGFERQKRLAQEQFEYEKARMERETQLRRQELERDLTAREQALTEKEAEFNQLRARASASAAELAAAVEKAIKETTERLTRESEAREALLRKGFEGEQKVLQSRIESLQQTAKEQQQQVARLSTQIEKSYGQVQEIAVKAIEGSGSVRVISSSQPPPAEKQRGAGQAEN
jgi:chromosome segregation ATPase